MRGPARLPSLVTWPMMIRAMLEVLASSMSCSVQYRTWEIDPEEEVMLRLDMTCMESMMASLGLVVLMVSRIVSRLNSLMAWRLSVVWPSRLERLAIWATLSSPEIKRTLWFLATSLATCSVRVDFPIPGSPDRRVRLPGMIPSPMTRSNSLMLVENFWVCSWVETLLSCCGV